MISDSDQKCMITNIDKTFYLHLAENPTTEPIHLCNNRKISSAENNEHLYLGMWFTTTNDIHLHVKNNLKHRAYNIQKFFNWLEINELTPIKIKLQVLDSCMFAAYLYGSECWWCIDKVSKSLLETERKILKSILRVKQSTPNDLLYIELDRCDIISKIKYRQMRFFQKCKELKRSEATLSKVLDFCSHLDGFRYYEEIDKDILMNSKTEMKLRISQSESTYAIRYNELSNCTYNDVLYNQYLYEDKRIVISRWRLSSHNLRIETGRYTRPKTPRDERTCGLCEAVVEDEQHVIFICPLYQRTREKYQQLLEKYESVSKLLNPTSLCDAEEVGNLLMDIEKIRKTLT